MRLPETIPTRTSRLLRISALRDAVIGLTITILAIAIVSIFQIDILESIYFFTRKQENWEINEIATGIILLGLFAIVFGIRRFIDIARLNAQITRLAYFDVTTHLPNRVFANDRLNQMLSQAKRHDKQLSVLFIDVDRFKMVNDTFGHANGDLLISSVGQRLLSVIRKEDTLARLGGDEFLIIVDLEKSVNEVHKLLQRITDSQTTPHKIDSWESYVNYSVGVAVYPKDGETTDELLVAADSAMYRAKDKGKGQFQFYSENIGQAISERYLLEMGLKKAIEKNQLSIKFQPLYDLRTKKITSYEALLRWKFNGRDISPELIIEIAEDTQYISLLGDWILREAINNAKPYLPADVKLAINVSPTQFKSTYFVENIFSIIASENFPIDQLILEITESALLTDFNDAHHKITQLRDAGIAIAIDDFGTGYSSLGRLTELKVDSLKIDRGFIRKMHNSPSDKNVIKAIIALANELNLKTIAEGVETAEQLSILEGLDCDELQGFYIGHPMPGQTIAEREKIEETFI